MNYGFLNDSSIPINGTIVQAYNLAVELRKRNHCVSYITPTRTEQHETTSNKNGVNVHWVTLRCPKIPQILYINKYRKLLKSINPDVVYNRGRSFLTYIGSRYSRKKGKIFVWASNGDDGCRKWKYTKKIISKKTTLLKKFVRFPFCVFEDLLTQKGIKNSTIIINQNIFQKNELLKYYHRNGLIIKSGHDIPKFRPSNKQRLILWLATLSTSKQPEIFIKIANELSCYNEWTFMLVGGSKDKEYVQYISDVCSKEKNITFIPGVPYDNTNEYFAKASVFVNTSKFDAEGIPNTFVQAWMNGTPVISLNHNPDGDFDKYKIGFYAKGDYQNVISSIKEFFADENKISEYSDNSFIYAKENYDIDKIVAQYEKLIFNESI